MIVVGYQGIGKSTAAQVVPGVIDLESSCFYVNGKRDDNWYKIYCNVSENLSKHGNIVCLSSHALVRYQLSRAVLDVKKLLVYPALELKSQWIFKLYDRYKRTGLDKDYKAWINAYERFDDNIKEIMAETTFEHRVIESINYSLADILMNELIKSTT